MDDSRFYNPHGDLHITKGNLPHWSQGGKPTFVTFRLRDSLPTHILLQRDKEFELFKRQNALTDEEAREIFLKDRHFDTDLILDCCHGSCLLRSPEARAVVERTLLSGNNMGYRLYCFAIMPNHVHLLLETKEASLQDIIPQIKGATARQINLLFATRGKVWQRESFDHIIRSATSLRAVRNYILNNPKNLQPQEYTIWDAGEGEMKL